MSRATSHEIECPECGHKQETHVWHSVNVSLDPQLKEQLFNGKINLFACSECEQKSLINVPLLYHDMHNQFCIQYFPFDALEDSRFLKQFSAEGDLLMPEDTSGIMSAINSYMANTHIVFDMGEMLRYIAFREILKNREDSGNGAFE